LLIRIPLHINQREGLSPRDRQLRQTSCNMHLPRNIRSANGSTDSRRAAKPRQSPLYGIEQDGIGRWASGQEANTYLSSVFERHAATLSAERFDGFSKVGTPEQIYTGRLGPGTE
jgi:hypothetical protein